MKKIILYGILLVAGIGAIVGYRMWNKPHKDILHASADVTVDAKTLYNTYETDEAAANGNYLDKIIVVSGTVRETSTDETGSVKVMLASDSEMGGVLCELDPLSEHKRTTFQVGEQVKLKGKCDGMLMDVVLTRCVEIE